MPRSSLELSVIIVAYEAADLLPACLDSLAAGLAGVRHEVCVVDNASPDGAAALLRERFPKAQVVRHERNLGFAAGVNAGLRATSGRFVLWLNPDAALAGGSMADLLKIFAAEPGLGIIGPRVMGPDGGDQASCRSFPSYRTALFNRKSLLTRLFPANRYSRAYLQPALDRSRSREVDWVSGACLLHRREVSAALGGLDERFFMFCEDVDFCLRAAQAGWKTLYAPDLRARHQIGGSTRLRPLRMIREHHLSMWVYYKKHFPRHPLKDAAVGTAILSRCGMKVLARAVSG